MSETVARFVADGDKVALGLSLESVIPFAAGHEMIRQRKRDLTLIGPISDMLFDMLIGGGTTRRVMAAWVGNVSTGLGYNFRRAVESGAVEMIDYSNFALSTALKAAADGLPFGLTFSLLGSDILACNPNLEETVCPFTGRKMVAVRALEPDVAVVNVQRADAEGNAHHWGHYGVIWEAVRAAKRTIVVCEELVDGEVIRSDPNRTLIPGFLVSAVVVEPWGAHPSGVQGYYAHDDEFYLDYAARTRRPQDAERWQAEWIDGVADRAEYIEKLGEERLNALKIRRNAFAAGVDYGY